MTTPDASPCVVDGWHRDPAGDRGPKPIPGSLYRNGPGTERELEANM